MVLTLGLAQQPKVAIVVDDLGNSLSQCNHFINITVTLNLAVIPGLSYSQKCANLISNSKHDLLIHFPWAPLGKDYQKHYPIHIASNMSANQIKQMLTKAFASVPNAQGVNNHMGSLISEDPVILNEFMAALAKHKNNKYFLDSSTSSKSIAYRTAKQHQLRSFKNHIFIDGVQTEEYISQKFAQAIKLAKAKGSIIMICHGNRRVTRAILQNLIDQYNGEVLFVGLSELNNKE